MDSRSIGFVIAAYTLTWVGLSIYTLYVHSLLRRSRGDLERATTPAAGRTS